MVIASVGIVRDTQCPLGLESGRIIVHGKGNDRLSSLKQHRRVVAQVPVTSGPLHATVVTQLDPAVITRLSLIIDGSG